MIYRTLFILMIMQVSLPAERALHFRDSLSGVSAYVMYHRALYDDRGKDPFEVIKEFTSSDAIQQNDKGQTVAMELLAKGMYGDLSHRFNHVFSHLVTITPVESFFTILDKDQNSLFSYIAKNSELTVKTLSVLTGRIFYEEGSKVAKKGTEEYRKHILEVLGCQNSFNSEVAFYLYNACMAKKDSSDELAPQ